MADVPRYRFGPLERRGVLMGLRAGQLGVVGCAIVVAVVALSSAPSASGLGVAALLALVAVAVAFVPLAGRTLEQWTPLATRWLVRGVRRQRRVTTTQPGRGVPATHKVEEQPEWPPALKGIELLAVPSQAGDIGVLKDRAAGTYTAVLSVRAKTFSLLDNPDKARRLASWAGILASAAREGGLVHRLQWLERTVPDPGTELAAHLETHAASDDPSVASYRELLADAGPVTQRHEVLVALQLSAARAQRHVKSAGGGDKGAGEVLRRELATLATRLGGAELTVLGALTPRLVAQCVRTSFDPPSRLALERRPEHPEGVGVAVAAASPTAVDEHWSHLQADGSLHATYWIAEWPRVDVDADFLAPLLLRTTSLRTVSLVCEPVSPLKAMRQVESARTQAAVDEQLRNKAGFLTTARRARETETLAEHESDLARGHAFFRFSGFVTVHATDTEELRSACGELEQAAAQSFLDLRLLHGQQADAFTWASLPLCRGLT
jgi:Putative type VII ESX secretion system translocon, EccE